MNQSNGAAVPELELIIKASTIDGRRKGACIFCQEYFMELYLLAELKTISLKVNKSRHFFVAILYESNLDMNSGNETPGTVLRMCQCRFPTSRQKPGL
jgi:hypothetical protein